MIITDTQNPMDSSGVTVIESPSSLSIKTVLSRYSASPVSTFTVSSYYSPSFFRSHFHNTARLISDIADTLDYIIEENHADYFFCVPTQTQFCDMVYRPFARPLIIKDFIGNIVVRMSKQPKVNLEMTLIYMLVYLDRYLTRNPEDWLHPLNIHELILSGMLLANQLVNSESKMSDKMDDQEADAAVLSVNSIYQTRFKSLVLEFENYH